MAQKTLFLYLNLFKNSNIDNNDYRKAAISFLANIQLC